uniref:(northern house mosquito) hypothetical protein n=1 Tax=Culex pipiens TaxID=7175 RepID=A0A8D8FKP9_CULPI
MPGDPFGCAEFVDFLLFGVVVEHCVQPGKFVLGAFKVLAIVGVNVRRHSASPDEPAQRSKERGGGEISNKFNVNGLRREAHKKANIGLGRCSTFVYRLQVQWTCVVYADDAKWATRDDPLSRKLADLLLNQFGIQSNATEAIAHHASGKNATTDGPEFLAHGGQ